MVHLAGVDHLKGLESRMWQLGLMFYYYSISSSPFSITWLEPQSQSHKANFIPFRLPAQGGDSHWPGCWGWLQLWLWDDTCHRVAWLGDPWVLWGHLKLHGNLAGALCPLSSHSDMLSHDRQSQEHRVEMVTPRRGGRYGKGDLSLQFFLFVFEKKKSKKVIRGL